VRALEAIAAQATDEGFVARFGRKVLEVLPPVGSHKGTAVRHLLDGAGLTRALVAGDDTTDLDAFRAVDGLECAVRVAVLSDESPEVLRDYAEIVIDSTGEFLELLDDAALGRSDLGRAQGANAKQCGREVSVHVPFERARHVSGRNRSGRWSDCRSGRRCGCRSGR